jgi:hypothetical protein
MDQTQPTRRPPSGHRRRVLVAVASAVVAALLLWRLLPNEPRPGSDPDDGSDSGRRPGS